MGNMALFITTSILLLLGLGAIIFLIRRSRSKSPAPDITPRGYEKLGSGGGFGGGGKHGGYTSASSSSYSGHGGSSGGHLREGQLVDLSERASGKGKIDDDDDDEDEDIVYMGQDGTVYRKFRYGQLGDNEDELEYDDESYTFR